MRDMVGPCATLSIALRYIICSKNQAKPMGGPMPKQAAAMNKRRVRGSKSGRPIMALLDLLGRRWTLRIIWELRDQPLTSRALREACDEASPTVLQARLSELREVGFVELLPGNGYRLTAIGKELLENFLPLHRFAERWSKRQAN